MNTEFRAADQRRADTRECGRRSWLRFHQRGTGGRGPYPGVGMGAGYEEGSTSRPAFVGDSHV